MKKSKINFILPFKPRRPAGGFRVMYEYANRFANSGYDVHITFPIEIPYMNYRFPYLIRKIITKIQGVDKDNWFTFNASITKSYVPRIEEKYIVDADIIITTWWSTVLEVSKLSDIKGKKINLIQGYENWEGHEDLLCKSYGLPNVQNIVVAKYLENIVKKHTTKDILLIPNAISEDKFYLCRSIEDRNPYRIIMTYSEQEIKGSDYGLKALIKVKEKHPQLEAIFFGVCSKPDHLPEWITFYRNPSNLCELYNSCSIILSNSLTEGFPLTPAEGMLCGCALIATDISGHKEYAVDNDTALLVPVKDVQILANAINQLIENNTLRINIAKRGHECIKKFSWNNSYRAMLEVVDKIQKISIIQTM